jgi:hypothetical protein
MDINMTKMFDAKVSALGHAVVCALVDASPHSRCTREDVAEKLNEKLGLDPSSNQAWDADAVRVAIRNGAFDKPGVREFYDFKGRFGGIRNVDLEATAEHLAGLAAKEEKAAARKAKREAAAKGE